GLADLAVVCVRRAGWPIAVVAWPKAEFLDAVSRTVDVSNVQRRARGPFGRLVQVLRPDALEPVPPGQEVQKGSIRRPPWRRFDILAVGHLDPFAFAHRYAVVQTRDHNRRTALLRPQRHVEREPLAI